MSGSIYRVALANKIRNGRAVGNLYGVMRYTADGRQTTWALKPQEDEQKARAFAAQMNRAAPKRMKIIYMGREVK